MGTPEFAVPSLDILYRNGFNIVSVITSTDKMGGRGKKILLESAVKKYAISKKIPVLQPKNLKNSAFVESLKKLKADIQVVVAFRMLPEIVWNMPKHGTINLHGSLLPKYRGAAPINWSLIAGDKETGVTSFKLKHEIDTGNIIHQQKIQIHANDNAGSLHDKMMHLGAITVLETIQDISAGTVHYLEQMEENVSKAPKIHHKDCEIDFHQPANKVRNFIRGMSPYPAAWFILLGELKMKVFDVEVSKPMEENDNKIEIGQVSTDGKKYLRIKCQEDFITLKLIQPEGKKKMDIKSFLNGNASLFKTLE